VIERRRVIEGRLVVEPKRKRPANRKRFTAQNVLKLPRKGKQYLTWDEGTDAARGLAILTSPTGTKSYRCVFYFPGSAKPYWMHLGRVGEMSLAKARARTREARWRAREGEDPRADASVHSDSFRAAVESFTRHESVGRRLNRSAQQSQSVVFFNCPQWLNRPIATIRSREIEHLLWTIRDGDGDRKARPYVANRLYSHLKGFFAWCARPGGPLKASPMTGMARPWSGAKPRSREWFKNAAGDDAIKVLWQTADKMGGTEGKYLKMMILTGKRKTALASMRWDEIDQTWFWNAPPSQIKNKRLHGIPLPSLAQRVIGPRQASGLVFAGANGAPFNPETMVTQIRSDSGIADFFFHGVRHLVETKLAELKDGNGRPTALPYIRDLLLDHAANRGAGHGYDHHNYRAEMLTVLEAWAGYVERLVTAEGVARLR